MKKTTLLLSFLTFLLISVSCQNSKKIQYPDVLSPSIREVISSNDKERVEQEFWDKIEENGYPLIEPANKSTEDYYLTFLWKEQEPVDRVVVVGGVAGFRFTENQMTKIENTNIWYRTYEVSGQLRSYYRLSPNDALIPFSEAKNPAERSSTFQTDPLNDNNFNLFGANFSVVELPEAPTNAWIGDEGDRIRQERLLDETFTSTILNNERTLTLQLPPDYSAENQYPLIIIFDGSVYTRSLNTPLMLDNMMEEQVIPSSIVVYFNNISGASRNNELPANPDFAQALAKELLPMLSKKYSISSDPEDRVLAGPSFGGLASSYVAYKYPEEFGNVLSQSGSYWWKPQADSTWGWLVNEFRNSEKLPLKFYMDVGKFENINVRGSGPTMIEINQEMRQVLEEKGYEVYYQEFTGGHEYINWRYTLADGLIFLIGDQTYLK